MFNLNRLAIRDEIKAKLHNKNISDTRLNLWINNAVDEIIRTLDPKYLEEEFFFSTSNNQRSYYIDCLIGRVRSITNTTYPRTLDEISELEIDQIDPMRLRKGTPVAYTLWGISEVSLQLAVAGTVKVVSSEAADITQKVRIIGQVSGVDTVEEITLTGTTAVTSTKSFDALSIKGCRLSAPCTGNMTMTDGTNTLVTIPVGYLFKQYQMVNIYPIPTAAYVMRTRALKSPMQMIGDNDVPDLPAEFQYLVVLGTLYQAHEDSYEFDRAATVLEQFDKEIEKLRIKDSSLRGKARKIRNRGVKPARRILGRYPTSGYQE